MTFQIHTKNHSLLTTALCSFSVIACVLAASSAQAIVPTNAPASADPGRVNERLRPEMRPEVSREPVVEDQSTPGRGPILSEGISFTLKSIEIQGATAFTPEELRPFYADLIGTRISLRTLQQVAEKITAHYRNSGYILSRAIVPPQRIGSGTPQIRVIEGYINKVRIEGESSDNTLIRRYADKISSMRPLNSADMERYLLLAEDLPGVSARGVLQPSENASGASDLVIRVSQKSLDGSVTADNRGSRSIGPFQGGLTLGANNILGMNERTQFRSIVTANSNELMYGDFSHEQQIGSEGTKAVVSYSIAQTNPGYRLKDFDIKGDSRTFSVGVKHPFLRSRQENIFAGLSLDLRETDASSLGTKLYDDKLRVARVDASYDFVDRWLGINRLDAVFSQGIGIDTGSSVNARSRSNGKTVFTKVNINASRLQPIQGPVSAYVALTSQLSQNPLLASEEMGLGGSSFGSAYDPSEITGDSGVAGRAELQYNGDFQSNFLQNYQYYAFYDVGKVFNRGQFAGESPSASLSSAGVGVRFNAVQALSGDLQVALPLTRGVANNAPNHGNDPRLFFNLAYRF